MAAKYARPTNATGHPNRLLYGLFTAQSQPPSPPHPGKFNDQMCLADIMAEPNMAASRSADAAIVTACVLLDRNPSWVDWRCDLTMVP
jgi:hypothetical protein